MIDFIIFLLITSLAYMVVFIFWSTVKSSGKIADGIVFCQTCFTFASIFIVLFFYFLFTGIEILNLPFLAGLSFTGIAYKIYSEQDRNKKQKQKVEKKYDKPYHFFWKELYYQTRLFIWEVIFLNIGLILIKYGGLK